MRSWLRGLAILAVASLGRPALAQQPGAEPIEPGLALLAAQMVYEAEPFAERLRVYVGPRPWEGRSESAVVRCDPASGRVRLELGALEVFLADGQMVAVRRDNPRDVLVRSYQPPLTMAKLGELLPPIPAPGLAVALDERLDDLAPYLAVEAWQGAEMDPAAGAVISGELDGVGGGGGKITVRLQRSGRVEHVVAQLAPERWISIQVTPAAPGDPAAWGIDPVARRRVDSLADLAPPRLLRAGDRAPDLFFVDLDGKPWRVSEAIEAGPVAIVLVRRAKAGAMEAGRAAVSALRERPELNAAAGVVYTMESWSLGSAREDAAALLQAPDGEAMEGGSDEGGSGGDGPAEGGAAVAALWSVSPRQIVDIAPGEPAVIVVVGADGVVAGVVPVAARAAPELAAELGAIAAAL